MAKTFKLDELGYTVTLDKFAKQADGSAWVQQGGTIVLATVVSAPSKDFQGFLPLSVDYREQFAAAGKIPGGYFKREGRPSANETLTSRLIDRSIRPLFPENYFNQVQVIITVYSVDKEHMPEPLAFVAASIALSTSKIPFMGPVGLVEMARVEGEWIANPTYQQKVASDERIIVAGNHEGVNMVEGSAAHMSEDELVDVIFKAHSFVKKQVEWQDQIVKEAGKPKEAVKNDIDWADWVKKADEFLTHDRLKSIFIEDKEKRNEAMASLIEAFLAQYEQEITDNDLPKNQIEYVLKQEMKTRFTELFFTEGHRVDGRAFDQVRKISTDVGLLPFTHGSALFTRGQTQALATVTLGGGSDEQKIESLMSDTIEERFMLHYNFPPFSVGEARFLRGPGRREIGHGYLARSAIVPVLPKKDDFPYTIRIVSDILESNGSSSMATVCGSIMALMNGGVPITKMVSGIAMGLLQSSEGKFQALSDISGFEDAFGLMDFKVAGTDEGITAIQMDIKYKGGLPKEVFEKALAQSKQGRAHILGEMRKVMTKPAEKLSELVPTVTIVKIKQDKIGAIIGSGGKTIKEIIEQTKTSIDIEPDGTVKIYSGPEAEKEWAINWVKTLAGQIEKGARYHGIIRRVAEFGLLVELVPGVSGLLHISKIPRDLQRNLDQNYQVGQELDIEVENYDPESDRIRLNMVQE